MNKEEFRNIRKKAGLSVKAMAEILKNTTGKGSIPLVNKMEAGQTPIQAYAKNEMLKIKIYGVESRGIEDDKIEVIRALDDSALEAFKRLSQLI